MSRKGCVVVGVVALGALLVLVALVWPSFRQLVVETKQKRVMADLLSWATAVRAYEEETGSLPPESGRVDEVLHRFLVPDLYPFPERYDFWGEPLEYAVSDDGKHFQIISRGWKGEPELPPGFVDLEPGTTSCYESDMVFQDDEFLRRPAGPQRGCTLGPIEGYWRIPQPPDEAMEELSRRD